MGGAAFPVQHGNKEINRQTILVGLVRLEFSAIFKAGFSVLKNLARLLNFKPPINVKDNPAYLAVNESTPGGFRHVAVGDEFVALGGNRRSIFESALFRGAVTGAFHCWAQPRVDETPQARQNNYARQRLEFT